MFRPLTGHALCLLLLAPAISLAQTPLQQTLREVNRTVREVGRTIKAVDETQRSLESLLYRQEGGQAQGGTRTYVGTEGAPSAAMISFAAPDLAFQNFSLAAFRELPLFGRAISRGGQNGFPSYSALLKMSMMRNLYAEMDPSALARYEGTGQAPQNNLFAQQNFAEVFHVVSTEATRARYMKASYSAGASRHFHNAAWAGSNEFESLRNFQTCVRLFKDDLLAWSAQMPTEGYVVLNNPLPNYNFGQGTFFLQSSIDHITQRVASYAMIPAAYNPRQDFEQGFGSRQTFDRYLKMSPQEAEDLLGKLDNYRNVYSIYRIKIELPLFDQLRSLNYSLTYSLATPVVELYADEALTQKIGEYRLY